MFEIRQDDLTDPATQALVALHLREMHANSPAGSVFALDLAQLRSAEVTIWTAWSDGRLAGMIALKILDGGAGEVKSMRTSSEFLRRGAATALLEHVILSARKRGLVRLSLETGSGPAFEPALALYARSGFAVCEAFGDYEPSAFNQFMHLDL